MVVSSHLLSLVEDLCTHLLILNHGKSLYCGKADDARGAFANAERRCIAGRSFLPCDGDCRNKLIAAAHLAT